jgi:hypothetical protein
LEQVAEVKRRVSNRRFEQTPRKLGVLSNRNGRSSSAGR